MAHARGDWRSIAYVAIVFRIAGAETTDWIYDPSSWGIFEQMYPELYNITCFSRPNATHPTRQEVPCQTIDILGLGWQTGGDPLLWPCRQFSFERMIGLINKQQTILPGYKIVTHWFDDSWSAYKAMHELSRELMNPDRHYAAVIQGSDPAATLINVLATHHRLPHLGFHVASELSDRSVAPWYFRTATANQDIYPYLIQIFLSMDWHQLGLVYETRYSVEAGILVDQTATSGITVVFKELVSFQTVFRSDRPRVSRRTKEMGLRLVYFWLDASIMMPLICGMILDGIAGVTPYWPFGTPWYNEPPSLDDPEIAEHDPGGRCTPDMLASWAEYGLTLSPKFGKFAGDLGGEHPVDCLPGEDAGGEFTRWWFDEFSREFSLNFPQPSAAFNSADLACVVVRMFEHLLFDLHKDVQFLSSRTQELMDLERDWLKRMNITNGMVGPVRFQHSDSWFGPHNGDMNPLVVAARLMKGNHNYAPTNTGKYDLLYLGDLPAAMSTIVDLPATGVSPPDSQEECAVGSVLGSAVVTNASGHYTWSSSCVPCPAGTRYFLIPSSTPNCVQCSPVATCIPCSPGSVSGGGAVACTTCPTASFAAGPSHCSDCPSGRFNDASGMTQCKACYPGHYAPHTGSEECYPCAAGLYQDQAGQTICKSCPREKVTFSQAARSVDACMCPSGTRAEGSGGDCVDCGEGLLCEWAAHFTMDDAMRGEAEAKILEATSNQFYPEVAPCYWASAGSSSTELVQGIFRCTSAERCPGGVPGTCTENALGRSCAMCVEGYTAAGETCKKCTSEAAILILSFCLTYVTVGVMIFIWNEKAAHTEAAEGVLASITVSVLLVFVQTLGIYSHINLDFPRVLHVFLEFFDLFLLNMSLLSPSCLFGDSLWVVYTFKLGAPLFVVLACLSWYAISKFFVYIPVGRLQPYSWDATLNTVGILMQFLYISMATAVFSIWCCAENPSGIGTLKEVPYTLCGEADHVVLQAIGVVAVLVYLVIPMAIYIHTVYVLPTRMSDRNFQIRYKFIYFKFSPTAYWYGGLHMARSLMLSLVPMGNDTYIQYLIMLGILIIFSGMHLLRLPYLDKYGNHLETYEAGCVVCIILLCSWFLQGDVVDASHVRENNVRAEHIAGIIFVLTVSCCIVLLGISSYALLLAVRPGYAQQLQERRIVRALPNLCGIAESITSLDEAQLKKMISGMSYQDFDAARQLAVYFGLEMHGRIAKPWGHRRLSQNRESLDCQTHRVSIIATMSGERSSVVSRTSTESESQPRAEETQGIDQDAPVMTWIRTKSIQLRGVIATMSGERSGGSQPQAGETEGGDQDTSAASTLQSLATTWIRTKSIQARDLLMSRGWLQ